MDTNKFYSVTEYEYSAYSYSGIREAGITYFRTREEAEAFKAKRMREIPEYAGDTVPSIEEECFS